MRKSNR